MRLLSGLAAGILLGCSAAGFAQATANQPSGFDLLRRVSQHYADAASYSLRATMQRTSSTEYEQQVEKIVLVAAQAPGNRFYYEGRGQFGSDIKVSDGKQVWDYHVDEHRYTVKPAGSSAASPVTPMNAMARFEAENARKRLADLAKNLKAAQRLPDETISVDGHTVACYLVRVQSSDEKRVPGYTYDKKIWIDKERETVLRIAEHSNTYMVSGAAHIPIRQESTTNYTAELGGAPRDSLFVFAPPADALLLADFPDPGDSFGTSLAGGPMPPLQLKAADGKVTSMDSFRSKPVLIDFWATWCAPCLASLPQLAELNKERSGKDLVILAIDLDEEPGNAAALLAKKGYTWPNYHGGDGEIEKLMGSSAVPRAVLIDAKGRIVYDGSGTNEDRLRTEIMKLGLAYASFAPKPKQATPCTASAAGLTAAGPLRSGKPLPPDTLAPSWLSWFLLFFLPILRDSPTKLRRRSAAAAPLSMSM